MLGPLPMVSPFNSFMVRHFARIASCGAKRLAAALGLLPGILAPVAVLASLTLLPLTVRAQSNEVLPVSQVREGMQGYAYTIFAGDQIEKLDLVVISVMPNFLGPRQSIILVQLKGPKVEHTGVVAGMSGSPVYLEGKLAGALSLKLGVFTKEPIAGVTPLADLFSLQMSPSIAPAMTAENRDSQNRLSL